MKPLSQKTAILTGTTASGKTSLAIQWALAHPSKAIEIINADSMLVYRGMDIGTAKPTLQEQQLIPHHLIDIRNPDEPFTAGDFFRTVQSTLCDLEACGKRALIVGGTGFYLKALLFGLWEAPPADPRVRENLNQLSNFELFTELTTKDPLAAERIGPQDRYRLMRAIEMMTLTGKTVTDLRNRHPEEPDPRFELLILDRPTDLLFARISARTREMIQTGLVEEVQKLQSLYLNTRPLSAVGYAQVCNYLAGTTPDGRKLKPGLDGLCDEIELATRQLVKRQRTWFRGVLSQQNSLQKKFASTFTLDQDSEALIEKLKLIY